MSESIANVNLTTDTFEGWLNRTNEIISTIDTTVVTANNTLGVTTGNGYVNGIFSANTLVAVDGLRGGNNSSNGDLIVTSNATVQGNLTVNGEAFFNSNVTISGLLSTANGTLELSTVNAETISANTVVIRNQLIANGAMGANGEVLTSNGTGLYWSPGGESGPGYTGSRGYTGSTVEIVATTTVSVFTYTIAANTGVITGPDDNAVSLEYTPGLENVYLNGSRQVYGTDYLTTNNSTITLTSNVEIDDIIQVVAIIPTANVVLGYTGSRGYNGSRGYTGSASTIQGPIGYTGSGYGTTASVQMGSLGVGTAASGTTGEIRATNNITAYYSDDRLKTRLGNIQSALEKVLSLNGFYFEPNKTAQELGYELKREVGVSAQEVNAILPEIVAPAPIDEKYMTIHYEKLIPLLIEAIKELNERIPK